MAEPIKTTATGDADDAPPVRRSRVLCALLLLAAASLAHCFLATNPHPYYKGDTWSYYEISRTVFTDFGRINTYRQSQYHEPYNVSFPPLYPALIAMWNAASGMKLYGARAVNLIVALLTGWTLMRIGSRAFGSVVFGVLLFASLLASAGYRAEMEAGRSIPLTLLFLVLALELVVCADLGKLKTFALTGVCGGLAALTRFDTSLAVLALGAVMAWQAPVTWPRRWASAGIYYLTVVLIVSPMIAYSHSHFHKLWATDNARTVLSVDSLFVLEYRPPSEHVRTLMDDPASWLENKSRGALKPLATLAGVIGLSAALPLSAAMLVWGVRRRPADQAPATDRTDPPGPLPRLLIFAPSVMLMLLPVCLTGYADPRYFPFTDFYLTALALALAVRLALHRARLTRSTLDSIAVAACAGLLIYVNLDVRFNHLIGPWPQAWALRNVLCVLPTAFVLLKKPSRRMRQVGFGAAVLVPLAMIVWGLAAHRYSWTSPTEASVREEFADLDRALALEPQPVRLILGIERGSDTLKYGALSGVTVHECPTNLIRPTDIPRTRAFLEEFQITHIAQCSKDFVDAARASFEVQELDDGRLLKILRPKPR